MLYDVTSRDGRLKGHFTHSLKYIFQCVPPVSQKQMFSGFICSNSKISILETSDEIKQMGIDLGFFCL